MRQVVCFIYFGLLLTYGDSAVRYRRSAGYGGNEGAGFSDGTGEGESSRNSKNGSFSGEHTGVIEAIRQDMKDNIGIVNEGLQDGVSAGAASGLEGGSRLNRKDEKIIYTTSDEGKSSGFVVTGTLGAEKDVYGSRGEQGSTGDRFCAGYSGEISGGLRDSKGYSADSLESSTSKTYSQNNSLSDTIRTGRDQSSKLGEVIGTDVYQTGHKDTNEGNTEYAHDEGFGSGNTSFIASKSEITVLSGKNDVKHQVTAGISGSIKKVSYNIKGEKANVGTGLSGNGSKTESSKFSSTTRNLDKGISDVKSGSGTLTENHANRGNKKNQETNGDNHGYGNSKAGNQGSGKVSISGHNEDDSIHQGTIQSEKRKVFGDGNVHGEGGAHDISNGAGKDITGEISANLRGEIRENSRESSNGVYKNKSRDSKSYNEYSGSIGDKENKDLSAENGSALGVITGEFGVNGSGNSDHGSKHGNSGGIHSLAEGIGISAGLASSSTIAPLHDNSSNKECTCVSKVNADALASANVQTSALTKAMTYG